MAKMIKDGALSQRTNEKKIVAMIMEVVYSV